MKIMWWLQILLRDVAVKRILGKFYSHRKIVRREEYEIAMHRRIKFYTKNYMKKLGLSM
jgi:hypothetical protein